MMDNKEIIQRLRFVAKYERNREYNEINVSDLINEAACMIDRLSEVNAELADDFISYATDGVNNPAPYCSNRTEHCTDKRGWCVNSAACKGFLPRFRIGDTE